MDDDIVFVIYDQARFKLDADVRRCWAFKGAKPIVYKNGSKKAINVGGAYSSTGEFHFYKMKWQIKEEVLWNIKLIRMKFPNMFFLLDKAPWNKSKMVTNYLDRNEIPYMFLPTGASDLNAVEECWRQTREDVTANKSHNSEKHLQNNLINYWCNKTFEHDMLNYLSP